MFLSLLLYGHLRGQDRGSVPTFGGSIPILPCGAAYSRFRSTLKQEAALHEKGTHAGRSALSTYASSRSRTRAARAAGGSDCPAGVRLESPGGEHSRKVILSNHTGGSGTAHTKGGSGGQVLRCGQNADKFMVDGALRHRPGITSRPGHQ